MGVDAQKTAKLTVLPADHQADWLYLVVGIEEFMTSQEQGGLANEQIFGGVVLKPVTLSCEHNANVIRSSSLYLEDNILSVLWKTLLNNLYKS